jgi:hypothetical protein
MSDELTGTDEGLDELLSTDGDERVVQQSAAVGAAVGAIFGAGRGPIGAGIGAGVGSATGYVVGRAIAADRRRRRDADADADPGIGPDAVNVPIGDDADESGGEGRDRSDVDRRDGAADIDDGPIHIDIDVEDEADEADAADATDAADADADDRADDDGRDDA